MSNELDFGPLACLIGTWEGDKGMDIAPEPDGKEENPYYETITFDAVGDVENGKEQILIVVGYHQVVTRKSTGLVFHDERGYWHWEPATGLIMQSLQIPRAVSVIAGGKAEVKDGETHFSVRATAKDPDWRIIESPFMRDNATTTAFKHDIYVKGDEMRYNETTGLKIYGKPFSHTDENVLKRVK